MSEGERKEVREKGREGENILRTYLRTYVPAYVPTYLPTYLTYLPHLPTYLGIKYITYQPNLPTTYLHTYLPTYLPTYVPACLPTYLPTYTPLPLPSWFIEVGSLPSSLSPAPGHPPPAIPLHACLHACSTLFHPCLGFAELTPSVIPLGLWQNFWYACCLSYERVFKSIRRYCCVTAFRYVSDYCRDDSDGGYGPIQASLSAVVRAYTLAPAERVPSFGARGPRRSRRHAERSKLARVALPLRFHMRAHSRRRL